MTVRIEKPAINVREELADLRKPSGVAGEAMLRADTPQEQFNLIGAGRRNVLINGDFSVSQRASYSSATSIASGDYCVDRWKANEAFNIQRFTNADVLGTNTNYVRMSYSNNSNMGFSQYIEDLNYKHMLGKECTFSAYVRTNYAESGLRYYDGQQNYGPRFIADEQWHKVTWTFTLRSGATTLGFLFDTYNNGSYQNGAASGDYIDIALVQLELGKVATPFEHRSYGEELALCQRYYQRYGETSTSNYGPTIGYGTFNGSAGSTTTEVISVFQFPVAMRTGPDFAFSALSDFDLEPFDDPITALTTFSHSSSFFHTVSAITTARETGFVGLICMDIANGWFEFDAEL